MAYCTQSDVEAIFGNNVGVWADVDDSGLNIPARVQHACDVASDEIDAEMSGSPYKLPLQKADGTVPALIKEIAATLAGVYLYELRGVVVEQNQPQPVHRFSYKRTWALAVLQDIKAGRKRLDLVLSVT